MLTTNRNVKNVELRKLIIEMVYRGGDGHIPSAFSILEIIRALYTRSLRYNKLNVKDPDRDIFILSKGHGCLALYTVLFECGLISRQDIDSFCKFGGILGEHPDRNKIPWVEANTGSLGHGFPFGVGQALGLKIRKKVNRVFVLLGDGECQEGSVWEAANIASNRKLGNIVALIDKNDSALQLMPIEDLKARWAAFGWKVLCADGHNEEHIYNALSSIDFAGDQPSAIICRTLKGYGVRRMEGHGQWHHKIPTKKELQEILEELDTE